jgi:uncharacterized OsmC-like protein
MTATQNIINGIDVDALHALINDVKADAAKGIAGFGVTTRWQGGAVSKTSVTGWSLGGRSHAKNFSIAIDEPAQLLGTNTAPNPQEHLLAAMNACLMATFVAVASAHGVALERLEIESEGELDLRGFLGIDPNVKAGYDELHYTIRVKSDAPRELIAKVHDAVVATSPNYFNMAQPIAMRSSLVVE